jgi:hypothetical protein
VSAAGVHLIFYLGTGEKERGGEQGLLTLGKARANSFIHNA